MGNFSVIASRNVKKGELITLYPVNAIRLKSHTADNDFDNKSIDLGVDATTFSPSNDFEIFNQQ